MKTNPLTLLAALVLATGCATYTFQDLLLDAHDIAYAGAAAVKVEAPEAVDDLQRAAAALLVIEASERPTVPMIAEALRHAGVKEINSPRGQLAVIGGTIVLNRAGRKLIAPEDYAKARELATALREGIDLGLGQ